MKIDNTTKTMHKLKFFLLIVMLSFKVSALTQKTRDSIYIYFDESLKYDDLHLKTTKNKSNMMFQYIYPDGFHLDLLTYSKSNLAKENFCRRKSFLKKIKILSIADFKTLGYDKSLKFLSKNNIVIFIIDEKESKNKIKIRRAYLKTTVENIM